MRTSLLMPLVTLVLVAGCASQTQYAAPKDAGPTPDARFHLTTTSISPGDGAQLGRWPARRQLHRL